MGHSSSEYFDITSHCACFRPPSTSNLVIRGDNPVSVLLSLKMCVLLIPAEKRNFRRMKEDTRDGAREGTKEGNLTCSKNLAV